ncbi:MAG: D-alanyl-D-alanine carboxypeptidase, partial [Clostridia bacterium]|nr:D-alanyl-D-alanine carboxypeptidase [Clostridia bacterium]
DAALTIAVNSARYLYGSELGVSDAIKQFMALCNDKLAELGCDNTHYVSPYGGTSTSHYTTARDIVKMSVYAMDNETFAEVAKTTKRSTTALTGEEHTWINTNYLVLPSNKYYYEYATGVKNGRSESAAFCLSASAVKDGRELFAVGLHAPSLSVRYADIKRFFEIAYGTIQ